MEEDYSRAGSGNAHRQASTGELMQSAKLMAGAAQSAYSGGAGSVDKTQVAGAAEDLLDAAQKYGKLDESTGVGQYVEKAEGYLHKYHTSGGGPAAGGRDGGESVGDRREGGESVGDYREGGESVGDYREGRETARDRREGGESVGDYREGGETARDRREEEEESRSGGAGGGVGEYLNMAKGFFK